ncbi:hypothetical protein [Undibacterium pigrum]|uniref:Uncharacterized protein n=1 Tax=Undibacterium pigrum TaxID=401470 RepID=A0A318J1A7_9BURK|nr:hypothetical protein [Undibacterium pigrum]PXX41375.1 hypothetical protein DFR42_10726 [Undibacterium pigrum]
MKHTHLSYLAGIALLAFSMSASAQDMRCIKSEVKDDQTCYKLSELRMNGDLRSFPLYQIRARDKSDEPVKTPFITVYDCKAEVMELQEDDQTFWGRIKANSDSSKKWRDSLCEEKNVPIDKNLKLSPSQGDGGRLAP